MLTNEKISTVVGDKAAALAAAEYPLSKADSPRAYGRGDYYLEKDPGRPEDAERSASVWAGDAGILEKYGLRLGAPVEKEQLANALQGLHAIDGETEVRKPGPGKEGPTVSILEMHMAVPKSVSIVWAMSSPEQRERIEQIVLAAAQRTIAHQLETKDVVYVGKDENDKKIYEPAKAWAASVTMHVTSRLAEGALVPDPQVHVHAHVIAAENSQGKLRAPESFELYRNDAALEGGAMFRLHAVDGLVEEGYTVVPETGEKFRFFEIEGISEAHIEDMSNRSRDVKRKQRELELARGERLSGLEAAGLASVTRRAKDRAVSPEEILRHWTVVAESHGVTHRTVAEMRRAPGHQYDRPFEERRAEAEAAFMAAMLEKGPTVTSSMARAILFEVSPGRLRPEEAYDLLNELERDGKVMALAGGRATSQPIRDTEERTLAAAKRGAEAPGEGLSEAAIQAGIAQAERRLGKSLDVEQVDAVRMLTGPQRWKVLTGRAGTGKGPTLDAVVAAHRHDGWQVIVTGPDHKTARAMELQTGAKAITVQQLKHRAEQETLVADKKTLVLIDETTKVGNAHWAEITALHERDGVAVLGVGHQGQHDAIASPGIFRELLRSKEVPTFELRRVRRHLHPDRSGDLHPWLGDLQLAVDERRAADAVKLLQDNGVLHIKGTRAEAIAAMVARWQELRGTYETEKMLMLVHGSNHDVDLVNVAAQGVRIANGELTGPGIQAIDRDYLIYEGDLVSLAVSAYRFGDERLADTPKRLENGQRGVVTKVDVERDWMEIEVEEPGAAEPRTVRIGLAALRAHQAAQQQLPPRQRDRVPALRLNYAGHTYPIQGLTLDATLSLDGAHTQGAEGTYVAYSRARFWHEVFSDAELLGLENSSEEQVAMLIKRIQTEMNRMASINFARDHDVRLGVDMPAFEPLPEFPLLETVGPQADLELEQALSTPDLIPPSDFEPSVRYDPQGSELPPPGEPPFDFEAAAAQFQPVDREQLEVPDPLRQLAGIFGPEGGERVEQLRARAEQLAPVYATQDLDTLRTERRDNAEAFTRVDRQGARDTRRAEGLLERAKELAQSTEVQAAELRAAAAQASGQARRDLEQRAAVQERVVASERARAQAQELAIERLHQERRHLDAWLDRTHDGVSDHERVARWAATERELTTRRELLTEQAAERAKHDPPAHVVEAIGGLPKRKARERVEWEALAAELERDWVAGELARQDGVKPPERSAREREQLAERVEAVRDARDLGPRDVRHARDPDPLQQHEQLLGEPHVAAIRAHMATTMREFASAGTDAVRSDRDASAEALAEVLAAARETAEVETRLGNARLDLLLAEKRAEWFALEATFEAAGAEREDSVDPRLVAMEAEARAEAAQKAALLAEAEREERELRESGRHLDDAMAARDEEGVAGLERVARWAAAVQELAVRRQVLVEQAAERAKVDVPEHVIETIGAPPPRSAPERLEYEALAAGLVRRRMAAELAQDDGVEPLPRDPDEPSRSTDFEARVRAMQRLQGVEAPDAARDSGRQSSGRGADRGDDGALDVGQ